MRVRESNAEKRWGSARGENRPPEAVSRHTADVNGGQTAYVEIGCSEAGATCRRRLSAPVKYARNRLAGVVAVGLVSSLSLMADCDDLVSIEIAYVGCVEVLVSLVPDAGLTFGCATER